MEHNNYLIKALDAYPYDIENAIESLNYALSSEPENPIALCLMGRIFYDVYQDYPTAIYYFERALAENVKTISVYTHYLHALTDNEDFEKALKFIEFALTVKGSNKGELYARKAGVLECQQEIDQAKEAIKLAKTFALNSSFMDHLEEFEKRLEKKDSEKKKTNDEEKVKKKKKLKKAKKTK